MKFTIWFSPHMKLVKDNFFEFFKSGKITIMCAKSSRRFPYPLDRIKVGTVWWKEFQPQDVSFLIQPWLNQFCMVPTGIVQNHNHLTTFSMMSHQCLQEDKECSRVECLFLTSNQTTIVHTNSAQNRNIFTCWGVFNDWIRLFRRDPHGAP